MKATCIHGKHISAKISASVEKGLLELAIIYFASSSPMMGYACHLHCIGSITKKLYHTVDPALKALKVTVCVAV